MFFSPADGKQQALQAAAEHKESRAQEQGVNLDNGGHDAFGLTRRENVAKHATVTIARQGRKGRAESDGVISLAGADQRQQVPNGGRQGIVFQLAYDPAHFCSRGSRNLVHHDLRWMSQPVLSGRHYVYTQQRRWDQSAGYRQYNEAGRYVECQFGLNDQRRSGFAKIAT